MFVGKDVVDDDNDGDLVLFGMIGSVFIALLLFWDVFFVVSCLRLFLIAQLLPDGFTLLHTIRGARHLLSWRLLLM